MDTTHRWWITAAAFALALTAGACGDANDEGDIIPVEPSEEVAHAALSSTTSSMPPGGSTTSTTLP